MAHKKDKFQRPLAPKVTVGDRYSELRMVGSGAFGEVRLFQDTRSSGRRVAIKKIRNIFDTECLTVRAVRELRFLRFFRGHRNVSVPMSVSRIRIMFNIR
jgi:mitogen-activated protein kinase